MFWSGQTAPLLSESLHHATRQLGAILLGRFPPQNWFPLTVRGAAHSRGLIRLPTLHRCSSTRRANIPKKRCDLRVYTRRGSRWASYPSFPTPSTHGFGDALCNASGDSLPVASPRLHRSHRTVPVHASYTDSESPQLSRGLLRKLSGRDLALGVDAPESFGYRHLCCGARLHKRHEESGDATIRTGS